MPSIQRNLLNRALIDHLAHGGCSGFDHGSVGRDIDSLLERTDFELKVFNESARYLDIEITDRGALESLGLNHD